MHVGFPLRQWLNWSIVAMATYAWISTPMLLARGAGFSYEVAWGIGLVSGSLLLGAVFWRGRQAGSVLIEQFLSRLATLAPIRIVIFGIVIRVAWMLIFPAVPSSDGAVYLELAGSLLNEGRFEVAGTRAYWPPGYSLFLVPWLAVFPDSLVIAVSQLVLYAIGGFGCFKLAERLSGWRSGYLALVLFSIWPNLVALAGTPRKEMLIIALLPWVCYFLISKSIGAIILAGCCFGFAILVQPSLQLLLPVTLIIIVLARGQGRYLNAIIFVIASATVVLPWSMRNVDVLGKFVLVSTNGGSNLYRANNPMATGGYTPRGEVDTSHLGEIEEDRTAKELAVTWITENPLKFAVLAIEKQVRFMGDDAVGVYASLKLGKGSESALTYAAIKLFSNLWWVSIWLIAATLALKKSKNENYHYLMIGWLYLFSIHSIFEADGKYHVPMLWVLCVWMGCAMSQNNPQRK